MDSSNELTEEDRLASILRREEQLLADLAAAEESVLQQEKIVKEAKKSKNTRNSDEYRRAKDDLESAENLVCSISFELLQCRLKRNDTDTTVVDSREFPQGYGKALGQALENNTMVTTLVLTATNFLPAAASPQVVPADYCQPMLDFLSTSSSLVDVEVILDPYNKARGEYTSFSTRPDHVNALADLMLKSVSSSKTIPKFCMRPFMSPLQFSSLMAQSKSLQELHVGFPEQHATDADREIIVQGLQANSALQRLTLWMQYDNYDEDVHPMPTFALKHLDLVPSLQELELEFDRHSDGTGRDGAFNQLALYLQVTSTLRRLTINEIQIHESLMEKLLSGLGQDSSGAPRIAISELSLDRCYVDVGSSERLLEFLQTPTIDMSGTIVYDSALRKLCINVEGWRQMQLPDDLLTDEQTQDCWKRLAESLLVPMDASSSDVTHTVGSQIEELYIIAVDPHFIDYLSNNASRCRLKRLGLYGPVPGMISEFLPKIGTVTDLFVMDDGDMTSTCLPKIAAALKYNGSITEVAAGPTAFNPYQGAFSDANEFTTGQLRFVQAYTDRNKFLGSAFGPASAPESNHGGGDDDDDPDSGDTSNSSAIQVDALQYPSILQSAMTIPASRVWQILVKCGRQCGPGQHVASNEPAESEQATSAVE